MTTATEEKPKAEKKSAPIPPVDSNGEARTAMFMLGRFRKELDKLPLPWRLWVAESLFQGCPVPDEQALDQS